MPARKGYGFFKQPLPGLKAGEEGTVALDVTFDASPDPRVILQAMAPGARRTMSGEGIRTAVTVTDGALREAVIARGDAPVGRTGRSLSPGTPVDISALGITPGTRVLLTARTRYLGPDQIEYSLETHQASVVIDTLTEVEAAWGCIGPFDSGENGFIGTLWGIEITFPGDHRLYGLNEGVGDTSLPRGQGGPLVWTNMVWQPPK